VSDPLADLLRVSEPPERTPVRAKVPAGWEPGIRWSAPTNTGTIVTEPLADQPDAALWRELIADWGLDPDGLEIVDGSIELIGWDSPVKGTKTGETVRLKRYKARLRQRGASAADRADVNALCRQASKRPPARATTPAGVPRSLVACLSDLQVGKGDNGGTAATVERLAGAQAALIARLRELRRVGRPVDSVYLLGMGDLVEGCDNHYASQAFTVDLDRAEQTRVVRRLILGFVDAVLDLAPRIVLAAVPGNHGENRRDGKAFTNVATDNDDLSTVETVAEIMAANPDRYGHVATMLARDYTMALDVNGVVVAFTHGHTARNSGHAAHVMEEWWRGQVMGRQAVADADILVVGHRHHLIVSEATSRTLLQCPAMDGGSDWFTASTGKHSPSGMLTFGVGREAYGVRGWGDLAVLS
jgi:predicted phosphodiesterase